MGQISDLAAAAYRPFVTTGIPASGVNEPSKTDIVALFGAIDGGLASAVNGLVVGNAVIWATQSLLFGDLAHAANTLGVVYNDSASANIGVYIKSGPSGSGGWTLTNLALPASFSATLSAAVANIASETARAIGAETGIVGSAASDRNTLGKITSLLGAAWTYTGNAIGVASALATNFAATGSPGFSVQDVLGQMTWSAQSRVGSGASGIVNLYVPTSVTRIYLHGYAAAGDGGDHHAISITDPGGTLPGWQFRTNGGNRCWQLDTVVTRTEQHGAFGCITGSDFVTTAGQHTVSRSGPTKFTSADVGKQVIIVGAGAIASSVSTAPYVLAWIGSIQSVDGSGVATLDTTCTTSGAGSTGTYGHVEHAQLTNALNYLATRGGGVLELGPKTYLIGNTGTYNYGGLKIPPGVLVRGQGIYLSILRSFGWGFRVINEWNDAGQAALGFGCIQDFSVWGGGDQTPTQSVDDRGDCVVLGPFNTCVAERIRVIHSEHIAMSLLGGVTRATACEVRYSYRDGINLWGTMARIAEFCDVRYCADDGIAAHIGSQTNGVADSQVVLIGNTLQFCTGFKALGARNAIIANNKTRFCYGYACYVGYDTVSNQGQAVPFAMQITDNIFTDTLGETVLGIGANGIAVIYFNGAEQLGSGGTAVAVYPGQYNSATRSILTPTAAYLNQGGSAIPRGAGFGIRVAGNIITQTLEGMTKFSDSGFGPLWWNEGPIDTAMTTNIALKGGALMAGIQLDGGAWSDMVFEQNMLNGVSQEFIATNCPVLRRVYYRKNMAKRVLTGPCIINTTATAVDVHFEENDLDLDPYFEASGTYGRAVDGNSAPTGCWAADGGSNYHALTVIGASGVKYRRNKLRNCLEILHKDSSVVHCSENEFYWDWSGGVGISTQKGIGVVPDGSYMMDKHFFEYSDPRNAAFGQPSATPDSAFFEVNGGQPSTGYYRLGQYIALSYNLVSGTRRLAGWKRATTAGCAAGASSPSGNVAGTDWIQDWRPTSTTG